jgi:hypothetical protein
MSSNTNPRTPGRVGARVLRLHGLGKNGSGICRHITRAGFAPPVARHFPVPYAAPRIAPDPAFSPLANAKDCDMNVGSATISATTDI